MCRHTCMHREGVCEEDRQAVTEIETDTDRQTNTQTDRQMEQTDRHIQSKPKRKTKAMKAGVRDKGQVTIRQHVCERAARNS